MSDEHRHDHGAGECKEIFARLSEYMDGELEVDLCAKLEGHLDDCPPCQAFLESLRRTVSLTERQETPRLPDEVRRRLRDAVNKLRGD